MAQPGMGHQGYAAPSPAMQGGQGGIGAKIKSNLPMSIAIVCFAFALLYGFVLGAFDISDRDLRRFLATSGLCSGSSGMVALLAGIYTRVTDREKAPTLGQALVCITLLVIVAGAAAALVIR